MGKVIIITPIGRIVCWRAEEVRLASAQLALEEADAWLAPFSRFWFGHVDALEHYLDRMDRSTPTKRKTRRR
jgi:hypothetical protein